MTNYSPEWLRELMDEFGHSTERKSDRSLRRMVDAFSGYDPEIMAAAVDDFLINDPRPVQQQAYFPAIAHLRPFVNSALERGRGVELSLDDRRALHDARMARLQASIIYNDEQIFEWERERDPEFGAGLT